MRNTLKSTLAAVVISGITAGAATDLHAAGGSESLKFVNLPVSMVSKSQFSITVQYDATEKSDLVLELKNPEGKVLKSTKVTVSAGSGSKQLSLDLGTYTPTPRAGHTFSCELRKVGTSTKIVQKPQNVTFTPNASHSGAPAAPNGKKWAKVSSLTDDFSGTSLDGGKWIDRHAGGWDGRDPSIYHSPNVSVGDGMLMLKSTVKNRNKSGNWVNAACVSSKTKAAKGGVGTYYEASIRGSDISMTSAFWFQGQKTEIDVTENFGHTTQGGSYYTAQRSQMMSNTHSFSRGWDNDLITPKHADMDAESDHKFFTYGVWWKDKNTVCMYLNGKKVNEMTPGEDFSEDQYMFFDTETFKWQGYPTLNELDDPDRNTMYVNWVRSYKLVDGDSDTPVVKPEVSFVALPDSMTASKNIPVIVNYTVSARQDLVVSLNSPDGKWLGAVRKTVNAGSGSLSAQINLNDLPATGQNYTITCDIRAVDGDWKTSLGNVKSKLTITAQETPDNPTEPGNPTDLDNPTDPGNPTDPDVEETISYTVVQDAYLENGKRYNTKELRVEAGKRTSYLQFDLGSVTRPIESMQLVMNVAGDAGNGKVSVAQASGSNWDENSLSKSNAPAADGVLAEVNGALPIGKKITVDVSKATLQGSKLSLIVTMASGGNDVSFASKEAGAEAPVLIVNYGAKESAVAGNMPQYGSTVSIIARANNKLISADKIIDPANAGAMANRTVAGLWEKFTFVDAGNGYIALKAHATNMFLTADSNYGYKLKANSKTIVEASKFQWIANDDKSFSLKAKINSRFVCADSYLDDAEYPLAANRNSAGAWEQFTWNAE